MGSCGEAACIAIEGFTRDDRMGRRHLGRGAADGRHVLGLEHAARQPRGPGAKIKMVANDGRGRRLPDAARLVAQKNGSNQ